MIGHAWLRSIEHKCSRKYLELLSPQRLQFIHGKGIADQLISYSS